jgi:4-hydroxy-tetrahydrodipicolinate synthase
MSRFYNFRPSGVIAATLVLFNEDYSIDERNTRSHLSHVGATRGLSAVTINGHSSEVHACTFDEQKRLLAIALNAIGDKLPLISGVYADGSLQAAQLAKMAEQEGASCMLVFPPQSMTMGGQLRPEMALAHFKCIADATDLPMILFQYPMSSGLGYPLDTILRLVREIPSIVAIKDWANDPMLHERQTRELQSLPRPINVLTTHSSWLMSSLVMGAKGVLSGAGSVIADLQVALFKAVSAGNLKLAQQINARIYPLVQLFYAPPALDMHNRMKECLRLLGRIEKAVVRPPLCKLSDREIDRLAQALAAAGIFREGATPFEPLRNVELQESSSETAAAPFAE